MESTTDAPTTEAQQILLTCARLQQNSRMLNDQLCVLKAGPYRAHSIEKNLRIALIMCKDDEIMGEYLLSEISLKEGKLVKFIVRQAITRLNVTIESMDMQWEGCIAHSNHIYRDLDAEFAVPLGLQMDHESREAIAALGGAQGFATCAETVASILSRNGLEQEELAMMEHATRRIAQHRLRRSSRQNPKYSLNLHSKMKIFSPLTF
jgi:hypothetical protein